MHGGASTGPSMAEGLERIRKPGRRMGGSGGDGPEARDGAGSDGWHEAADGAEMTGAVRRTTGRIVGRDVIPMPRKPSVASPR
jgi:hypothetical protein